MAFDETKHSNSLVSLVSWIQLISTLYSSSTVELDWNWWGAKYLSVILVVTLVCRGLDTSLLPEEQQQPQRLTPTKFTTAHAKGVLTPRGQLIKVLAHYPLDGQPATIEVHEALACCQAVRAQLQDFPGPLVKYVVDSFLLFFLEATLAVRAAIINDWSIPLDTLVLSISSL